MTMYAGLLVLCLWVVYDLALTQVSTDSTGGSEATCPSAPAQPVRSAPPSARLI